MNTFRVVALCGMVVVGLALSFASGVVYAASQRLYDADTAIVKAIALLKAAENPGVDPPFGGHDKKAIKRAKKARKHIAEAIAYADGMR